MNKKSFIYPYIFYFIVLIFTSCYSNNKNSDISNSQITSKENNETVDINVDNSSEDKQTIFKSTNFLWSKLKI